MKIERKSKEIPSRVTRLLRSIVWCYVVALHPCAVHCAAGIPRHTLATDTIRRGRIIEVRYLPRLCAPRSAARLCGRCPSTRSTRATHTNGVPPASLHCGTAPPPLLLTDTPFPRHMHLFVARCPSSVLPPRRSTAGARAELSDQLRPAAVDASVTTVQTDMYTRLVSHPCDRDSSASAVHTR